MNFPMASGKVVYSRDLQGNWLSYFMCSKSKVVIEGLLEYFFQRRPSSNILFKK